MRTNAGSDNPSPHAYRGQLKPPKITGTEFLSINRYIFTTDKLRNATHFCNMYQVLMFFHRVGFLDPGILEDEVLLLVLHSQTCVARPTKDCVP